MLDLIIGKRELGKTTLAISISKAFETVVIFDPRHMIETTSDILTENSIDNLYDLLDTRAEVIVRPVFDVQGAFERMCSEIFEWLQDNKDVRFCLLVDECRFVRNPELIPAFDYIVRCTPRNNVVVIMTCHGITDVSTDLRRIADYLILFRITLEADLDRVRERCSMEVADIVQKLAPFQYIVWNDGNSTFKLHTESAKWFVPLKTIQLVERTA